MTRSITVQELEVLGRLLKTVEFEAGTDGVGMDGQIRLWWDSANGYLRLQWYSIEDAAWHSFDPTTHLDTLYAPIDANYLVGTANATLTGEIVAGTSPGGELGGTWASPTVDATHSGSAHHAESHTHASHTSIGANDHHNEAHTVASHSDTTATGTQLNTLVGGGSTTLHTHTLGMGSLAYSNDSEQSTVNTVEEDVLDITSLSIAANHTIRLEFNTRMDNNSAGVRNFAIGLHLNGSEIRSAINPVVGTTAGVDASGAVQVIIPPRVTNYVYGGRFDYQYSTNGTAATTITSAVLATTALPTATITSITIRGLVSGADCLGYVNNVRVWELPN